jgi:putative serine protease PepD
VLIAKLTPGGAAEKAGLKVGDVIVKIDNTAIDSSSTLIDSLLAKSPGDKVTVHFYRGTKQMTVDVTLGELSSGN